MPNDNFEEMNHENFPDLYPDPNLPSEVAKRRIYERALEKSQIYDEQKAELEILEKFYSNSFRFSSLRSSRRT